MVKLLQANGLDSRVALRNFGEQAVEAWGVSLGVAQRVGFAAALEELAGQELITCLWVNWQGPDALLVASYEVDPSVSFEELSLYESCGGDGLWNRSTESVLQGDNGLEFLIRQPGFYCLIGRSP